MAPELMRKRIIKRSMRIVRPPAELLPALKCVGTEELEKLSSTIDLGFDADPTYRQGYLLLRQDLEEKLRDSRFRGYDWHIKKYQVVFDENLRAIADRARTDIVATLKFREPKLKLRRSI